MSSQSLDSSSVVQFVHRGEPDDSIKAKSLGELIISIREVFQNEVVNVDEVKALLKSYEVERRDWNNLVLKEDNKFTRNLIDEVEGKYNVFLLWWDKGYESKIHDHNGTHCLMKVLNGELLETVFNWPQKKDGKNTSTLEIINKKKMNKDFVSYINDSIGIHQLSNLSNQQPAISLHIYSPPLKNCKIFDASTLAETNVEMIYHSKINKH